VCVVTLSLRISWRGGSDRNTAGFFFGALIHLPHMKRFVDIAGSFFASTAVIGGRQRSFYRGQHVLVFQH